MAAKADAQLKPGTLVVFSNGVWKPLNNTPWEGLEKRKHFQPHLKEIKAGKLQHYNGHSFMMVRESHASGKR